MAFINIDPELLISEVENRRNLWNAGDENYKDRDIRLQSWQDVTSIVVKNYDKMSGNDQKKAGKFLLTTFVKNIYFYIISYILRINNT